MSVPHSLIEQEDGPEVARSACCGAKKQTCVICTITLCPRYPEQHRCFHLSAPEIHVSCGPWPTRMCVRVCTSFPRVHGLESQQLKDGGSSLKCSALAEPIAFRTPRVPYTAWQHHTGCREGSVPEWVWRQCDVNPHGPSLHH